MAADRAAVVPVSLRLLSSAAPGKIIRVDNMNQSLRNAEYAVRGELAIKGEKLKQVWSPLIFNRSIVVDLLLLLLLPLLPTTTTAAMVTTTTSYGLGSRPGSQASI